MYVLTQEQTTTTTNTALFPDDKCVCDGYGLISDNTSGLTLFSELFAPADQTLPGHIYHIMYVIWCQSSGWTLTYNCSLRDCDSDNTKVTKHTRYHTHFYDFLVETIEILFCSFNRSMVECWFVAFIQSTDGQS